MMDPDSHRPETTGARRREAGASDNPLKRESDAPPMRRAVGGVGSTGSAPAAVPAVAGGPAAAGGYVAPANAGSTQTRVKPKVVDFGFPEPGDRIDIFELIEVIGAGGMGTVFRAIDTKLERQIALKILPPEQSGDNDVVQRFYQEARAAARLDHENIARVYTIDHDGKYHYIAFEFIEGDTLRKRVEEHGPLPIAEAVNYTLQIAHALVHAADRGVVHRDVKPSNIIVTPQGRVKLVDMGLARRFERHRDDGLTQSGMTLGTFDYISPEQARDPRDVDARSDLYSLGCTLFHMLTGRPPFPEGTVLQKLLQHQEEPPPDVRALNATVPDDLAAILVTLMAKDRERRYQTPEQLVRDLLTIAGKLGLRSVSPEGLIWMSATTPQTWIRHLVWAIPGFLLAAIVAGLVWWQESTVDESLVDATHAGPLVVAKSPGSSTSSARAQPRGGDDAAGSTVSGSNAGVAPRRPNESGRVSSTTVVRSSDDLSRAIESAADRGVVVLADEGPYWIPAPRPTRDRKGFAAGIRLSNKTLTIQAQAGVRPVLTFDDGAPTGSTTIGDETMFEIRDGRIVFEGLIFHVDSGESDAARSALVVDGAEITARDCQFLGKGEATSRRPGSAVHIINREPRREGTRPAPIRFESCHFDPGPVAFRGDGPIDLNLLDCTIAATESAFRIENASALSSAVSTINLVHVSILIGESPVFDFRDANATVRIDDSVIAARGDASGTLIAIDDPAALDWFGRGNLYGRVRSFLQPTRSGAAAIDRFENWRVAARELRESGSIAVDDLVWRAPNPRAALSQENPTRSFQIAATDRPAIDTGARSSPWGRIPAAPFHEKASVTTVPPGTGDNGEKPAAPRSDRVKKLEIDDILSHSTEAAEPFDATATSKVRGGLEERSPAGDGASTGGGSSAGKSTESIVIKPVESPPKRASVAESATGLEVASSPPIGPAETDFDPTGGAFKPMAVTPMTTQPPVDTEASATTTARGNDGAFTEGSGESPGSRGTSRSATKTTGESPSRSNRSATSADASKDIKPSISIKPTGNEGDGASIEATTKGSPALIKAESIRSSARFLESYRALGNRGGVLRIAADADFELPTVEIGGRARYRIVADAGSTRPKIRFQPARSAPDAPALRAPLFLIEPGGSLVVEGIDVILEEKHAPENGRWSAFAIREGTDLHLMACSVTVEGDHPRSSLVAVRAGEDELDFGGVIENGEALSAGVRVDDCLLRGGGDFIDVAPGRRLDVAISDALVVLGGTFVHAHATSKETASGPINLALRQVTLIGTGGLATLDAAQGDTELPPIEIVVRDSILATTSDRSPIIKISPKSPLDPLRDPIRWEGHGVAYHQVRTYRIDESPRPGEPQKVYDQAAWEMLVGPREDAPIHGDIKFLAPWPLVKKPWTIGRSDATLAPDRPAPAAGADLERVPEPSLRLTDNINE